MLSYDRLSKKPLLFKSFTGLTVHKSSIVSITKKDSQKILQIWAATFLSSKRKNRKRAMGAGRPFKLDVKDRFLMILVYYRLYMHILYGWFFIWFGWVIYVETYKKDWRLVRQCLPIPQKIYNITKRLKTPDEVEQYFPGFMSFIDCT